MFTMMGYLPFLLSDKISTSQSLPLLTLRLLDSWPESKHVIDKSSKAIFPQGVSHVTPERKEDF